jgi:hypothetical protein
MLSPTLAPAINNETLVMRITTIGPLRATAPAAVLVAGENVAFEI